MCLSFLLRINVVSIVYDTVNNIEFWQRHNFHTLLYIPVVKNEIEILFPISYRKTPFRSRPGKVVGATDHESSFHDKLVLR